MVTDGQTYHLLFIDCEDKCVSYTHPISLSIEADIGQAGARIEMKEILPQLVYLFEYSCKV